MGRLRFWLFLLCAGISSLACAHSPVWRVSDGKNYFYLAGSVHWLRPTDEIPEAFFKGFADSQILVKESHSEGPPDYSVGVLKGQKLDTQLSPEVSKAFKEMVFTRSSAGNYYWNLLNNFNPYRAALDFAQFLYSRENYKAEIGPEVVFTKLAKQRNLPIESLEPSNYASIRLGEIGGDKYGNQHVQGLVVRNFDLPLMPTVVAQWQQGRAESLIELEKKDDPIVHGVTITERNALWLPKIVGFLATPEVEFVLVGFSHLIDPADGLLKSLRERGYKVEQMP